MAHPYKKEACGGRAMAQKRYADGGRTDIGGHPLPTIVPKNTPGNPDTSIAGHQMRGAARITDRRITQSKPYQPRPDFPPKQNDVDARMDSVSMLGRKMRERELSKTIFGDD